MMNYLCSDCVNIFKVFAKVKFIPVRTGKYLTTETLSGNDVQTAPKIFENFWIFLRILKILLIRYFGISRHFQQINKTNRFGVSRAV